MFISSIAKILPQNKRAVLAHYCLTRHEQLTASDKAVRFSQLVIIFWNRCFNIVEYKILQFTSTMVRKFIDPAFR